MAESPRANDAQSASSSPTNPSSLPPQDASDSAKQQTATKSSGEGAKSPLAISPEFADLSDQMLGEFRLIRKLGAGGMAEVYLAEQTTLRRQVAVKILRPQFVTDEHYVKRFRHEAAAAGSLNHPNIVQVYLVGEDRGTNYIAQEYVQGRNLKDYITRKGPLDVKIALHILRQVASALQVASENGIVHRDIKPENILLTNKAEAKVADFGLAQLTFQGERVSLTQTGLTLGTPLYMSPEQVNGLSLDSRSDIYSFGIMTWYMLAGRPPFVGETAMAVAVKHLNDKPPALTDFRQDIPAALLDLIKRMVSKKKEDRPNDFSLIVAELKQLLRQVSGKDAVTVSSPIPAKKRWIFDRPLRSQIGWLIGVCVFVLASSAGIGWAMRTPNPLLTESRGPLKVQVMPTAEAQLYWAMTNPHDEAAWVAVKTHSSGATNEMKARATAALGLIYLKTKRLSFAQTAFQDLAIEAKYKINSLAGQALSAKLSGDADAARKLMAQVEGMDGKLFPEMEVACKDLRKRLDPEN